MGIFIQKKVIIITKLSQRSSLYLLFTLDTCWNNGGGCQLAKQKKISLDKYVILMNIEIISYLELWYNDAKQFHLIALINYDNVIYLVLPKITVLCGIFDKTMNYTFFNPVNDK